MSYKRSTLQRPDGQFIVIANLITEQSNTHQYEWQLDSEQVTRLQTLTASANNAYANNNNPTIKNHITAVAKQFAFDELKHFLGTYIDFLVGNVRVPDESLAVMQLRPRSHPARQPIPIPTIQPIMSVVRKHDELEIHVSQPQISSLASIAPKHYHSFALRWKFEDEDEYRTVTSTRLKYTLLFSQKDETRRIRLSVAFVNPRLQPGPWSDEISEVIG
jgi:hypothetical protein